MTEINIRHSKARKNHRCCWCGEIIKKGEVYVKSAVVYDGIWTKKMHLECEEAECAYDFDGEEHCYEGQMGRGHNHECGYDSSFNCAEMGCPACLKLPIITAENADYSFIIDSLREHNGLVISDSQVFDVINAIYRMKDNEFDKIIKVLLDIGIIRSSSSNYEVAI